MSTQTNETARVANPNSVSELAAESPTVVSLSDIHGYLAEAQSALRLVNDAYETPLVEADSEGRLHWACRDEYVIVVAGDAVDRGPENTATLEMIRRLRAEAPPGHVVFLLGNHEANALFPSVYHWPEWYSGNPPDGVADRLLADTAAGRLSVAFEAYGRTYVHAGSNDPFSVQEMNATLREAGKTLHAARADGNWEDKQRRAYEQSSDVVGMGTRDVRGSDAGLVWMDWRHMESDAPPQIVGHTRTGRPTRRGDAINANTIRANLQNDGGEAVTVATRDHIEGLIRSSDGTARVAKLTD
jgi:hypothetical protein